MSYDIKRVDRMNRVYFTPPPGLYVPGARNGDKPGRYWIGFASVPRGGVSVMLDALVAERDRQAALQAAYDAVKGEMPTDYRRRHGALVGGTVSIGDWSDEIHPVAMGFLQTKPEWSEIARLVNERGYGNTLYRTVLSDGRPVYRETHIQYDDWRETYYFPEDLFRAVCVAEIHARGITRAKAEAWLSEYRGCVDTELYELAATLTPAPELISAAQHLAPHNVQLVTGAGTEPGTKAN